ncbi:MAG TPA: copper resistance protein CopC [Actinomycetota bacterium]|nr:copper resistance protein CopC [Actinomycetota bacterium]
MALLLRASILALALVGWSAAPALAAPQMLSSDPEEGAQLHKPPARVSVTLSEPLTGESDIKVTDDCGAVVSVGDAKVGGTANNELSIAVGDAPHHGTYLVQWYGTGVTGTGSGRFTFSVHAGSGCDGGGDNGGHEGHGGKGGSDGSGNGGGHQGHSGGSGNREGSGHSGTHSGSGSGMEHSDTAGHSNMSDHSGSRHTDSGRHDDGGMHKGRGHGKNRGKHNGGHGNHQGGRHGDDRDVIAGGPGGPPTDIPTVTTVVIALGLAVLMGAVGGWVLRVATPR